MECSMVRENSNKHQMDQNILETGKTTKFEDKVPKQQTMAL